MIFLFSATASVAYADDVRYQSAADLQKLQQRNAQKRAEKQRQAKKQEWIRQNRAKSAKGKATSATASTSRANRKASTNNRSTKRRAQASVASAPKAKPAPPKRIVADTIETLEQNLPTKRSEINKTLDVIDHIRTFYTINRGADLTDLQQDSRFKEIYESMSPEAKKSTYLYLKGLYENSPQAIVDKNETPGVTRLAELRLNRKYTPSKTDIDGFNERTSIKSKLVRSLGGTYSRPAVKKDETLALPDFEADAQAIQ